jgi:hypothetical protein
MNRILVAAVLFVALTVPALMAVKAHAGTCTTQRVGNTGWLTAGVSVQYSWAALFVCHGQA